MSLVVYFGKVSRLKTADKGSRPGETFPYVVIQRAWTLDKSMLSWKPLGNLNFLCSKVAVALIITVVVSGVFSQI